MSENTIILLPVDISALNKSTSSISHVRVLDKQVELIRGADSAKFKILNSSDRDQEIDRLLKICKDSKSPIDTQNDVMTIVSKTRSILKLNSTEEFSENKFLWESLFLVSDANNGFVFTHNSLILPNGAVIFGELKNQT